VAPLEKHLLEQETYGERAAKARSDALQSARSAALTALGVSPLALPADLANLTDEEWLCIITDAQEAKAARDEMARQAEVARAKREQEQRAENERLRAEKAERDKKIAELGAVEITKSSVTGPTGNRAQSESASTPVDGGVPSRGEDKPEPRGAMPRSGDGGERPALSQPPTKARYMIMLSALRKIARGTRLDPSAALAQDAIAEIGEEP
jgi:hypothetical protein